MTDEAVRLNWDDIAPAGAVSLVVRHGGFPATSVAHDHDFAEVFVVESGAALHERGGTECSLCAGDVIFVLPQDTHRFIAPTADFRITNVAFPDHVLGALREAIPEADRAWSAASDGSVTLGPTEKVRVLRLAHDLTRSNTRLHLTRLVVEILLSVEPDREAFCEPSWIREALSAWQRDEDAMRDGVAGLARISGRSRGHVSRMVRSATGRRAIDVVNESRLELAAGFLQTTDDGIAKIASKVGFSGLSHFYRLFRRHFGVTPGMFRRAHQAVVNPISPDRSHHPG